MVNRYAILDSNNVALNFVSWDGIAPFDYGEDKGNQLVLVPDGAEYCIGATFKDGTFVLPEEPTQEPEIL